MTIAWDLGRKRDGSRIGTNVYEALRTNAENELDGEEELLGTRRLKELVIRVLDKQEEKYILGFVKAGWVCDGIEEKVRDEWRSRLRFEVVETRWFVSSSRPLPVTSLTGFTSRFHADQL